MIKKAVLKALSDQINKELYSAYLYLSMAGYFEQQSLKGFANWMKVQAQEETSHAMIMYNYVYDQGGQVEFKGITNPSAEYKAPVDVFAHVVEHEQGVTELINGIVALATKENDFAAHQFLQWFVAEQVEEEASAGEIHAKLKLMGNDGSALLMIDKDLATRVFTMPAPLVGK